MLAKINWCFLLCPFCGGYLLPLYMRVILAGNWHGQALA